jgi:thiosulfate dehydrogenase
MKNRFFPGLITGVILTIVLIVVGGYLYLVGGYAPVATSAPPLPFEKTLTGIALNARMNKELPQNVPIEATEANLLAGAKIYQKDCAVCHGLPEGTKTAIAKGMFPPPPQLLMGKGVTDDSAGESYWKVANGIRLTGMPGFRNTLKDEQLWQVSLFLQKADKLPASVKDILTQKDSPAGKL